MSREDYAGPESRTKPGACRLSISAERTLLGAVALLILIPCFWQPHIIAGDLPSHLYNAWLAGQIEQGKLAGEGLRVAHPITNVLADWVLQLLLYRWGPSAAERIVVGAAVEIFFWGTFFFVAAVSGQRSWIIAPSLAMITYGLIFHLGFLNFYISTGLSLWLMALLWHPRLPSLWLAVPCAILAILAHAMPLAWATGALLYAYCLRRVREGQRVFVFIVGGCLLILAHATLLLLFPTRWLLSDLVGLDGILGLAGVGQLWIYGGFYFVVVAGILVIWFVLFLERLDRGSIVGDPLVHIWGLTILAYILLPGMIQFTQYRLPLEFIEVRISLFIAILFCAMVAGGSHGRSLTRASSLLAALFFTLSYADAKSLNQVEAQLSGILSALPPGQRVVAELRDSTSPRLDGLVHVVSVACLGRCWDYGNYEPATGQFRVRVSVRNGVVVDRISIVAEIQSGEHIVTAREAPIYSVCPSEDGHTPFKLQRLEAGEKTCLVLLPVTDHSHTR